MGSDDESSVIIELVNVGDNFEIFRGEATLLLEASDLNSKNFSLIIAQILLKPKSIVYIETDHLSKKGGERLRLILEDIKNLFDDRLWTILVCQNQSSEKFSSLVEKQFDLNQSSKLVNKKRKIGEKISDGNNVKRGTKYMETSSLFKKELEMEEGRFIDSESDLKRKINQLEVEVLEGKEERLVIVREKEKSSRELQDELTAQKEKFKTLEVNAVNRERELLDLNVKFKEEIEEYKAKLEVLTEKVRGGEQNIDEKIKREDELLSLTEEQRKELKELNDVVKELQGKDEKYDECLKEKEKELKCLLVSSVTQVEDEKAKVEDLEKKVLSYKQRFDEERNAEKNRVLLEDEWENKLEKEIKEKLEGGFQLQLEEKETCFEQERRKFEDILKEVEDLKEKSLSFEEDLKVKEIILKEKILKIEILEEEIENQKRSPSLIDKHSQTKTVAVFDSPITRIVSKIEKYRVQFPEAGSIELLNRSIPNLKYSVSFEQITDQTKCDLKIVGGKGIMEVNELLSWESYDAIEVEAKSKAFDMLLHKLLKLETES